MRTRYEKEVKATRKWLTEQETDTIAIRTLRFTCHTQYLEDLISHWLKKKIKNKIDSQSLTFSASFTLYLHKLNIKFVVWRRLMLSLMAWKRNGNPWRTQMITLETVLMKQDHSCADKASSAGGYAAYATHSAKTQIEARSTMLDSWMTQFLIAIVFLS